MLLNIMKFEKKVDDDYDYDDVYDGGDDDDKSSCSDNVNESHNKVPK